MTGFGRGEAAVGAASAIVELRSVNKRFFEVSVRAPSRLAAREQAVQARLKEAFARGRLTAHVKLDEEAPDKALPVEVDEDAAAAYGQLLERLRTAAGIHEPVGLEHLLQFSDVLTSTDEEKDAEVSGDAWAAVEAALDEAVAALRTMRRQEGEALHADLTARLGAIETALKAVEARAPQRLENARSRLRERLEEVFADERVRAERLEAEIALVADRYDITEECVRLRSHLQLFGEALGGTEPVGRKLKFLVQELHREVNTIGSKANDAAISHRAVQMKEEVEKIREQVANVE